MSDGGCENCGFRAKVDSNPRSILGRLWRWHAGFCPGWRRYIRSLPDDEKAMLIEKYGLSPAKFA